MLCLCLAQHLALLCKRVENDEMTDERVEIPARRIGRHAYEYLATCDRPGWVVGTFRSGLSLEFGQERNARVVVLQTPDTPLHPWAVEVEVLPRNLAPDDPVTCGKSILSIRHWRYGWNHEALRRLEIAPYSEDQYQTARSRLPILTEALKAAPEPSSSAALENAFQEHLEIWKKSRKTEHLALLAGLGTGSTPAGDDFLVGILAAWGALWAAVPQIRSQYEELWAVVDVIAAHGRTTKPSAQMLQAAADGAFPEPLFDLAHMLGAAETADEDLSQATARLLAQGATSGASMLQGLVTGFEAAV